MFFASSRGGAPSPRACPVCWRKNQPARVLGEVADTISSLVGSPPSHSLVSCEYCDLIYLSPLPSQMVFDQMYVERMQFERADGTDITSFYEGRLGRMLGRSSLKGPFNVLEIGAGCAWMSRASKNLGASNRTVAQDLTGEAVAFSAWVDHYYVGSLEQVAPNLKRHAPYQVISITHVIEHVPDPIHLLWQCRELLDPQGLIFITAPSRPTDWADTSSVSVWRQWAYNHVPAHLQYFSRKSLTRAASAAGLQVAFLDIEHEEGQVFEAWLARIEPSLPHRLLQAKERLHHRLIRNALRPAHIPLRSAESDSRAPQHWIPDQVPHEFHPGARILSVRLLDSRGNDTVLVQSGDETTVVVELEFSSEISNPVVGFLIRRSVYGYPTTVYDTNTLWRGRDTGHFRSGDVVRIRYRQRMELGPGRYSLSAAIAGPRGKLFHDWKEAAISFQVIEAEGMQGIANLHSTIEIEKEPSPGA